MKIHLNKIFLMSVLLLGIVGYPSSQLTPGSDPNVDDNFLDFFTNIAYADEDENERDDEKKHDEREDEHEDEDERDEDKHKEGETEDEHEGERDDGKEEDQPEDEKEHDDEREDEHENEDEIEDETEDEHEDEQPGEGSEEEEDFEIKGIVELIDLIAQSFTLDSGETIFVDENTKFDHFDSLSDLQDFAVQVEVITSNNSLIAKEIEKEHEDKSSKASQEDKEESIQTALDLIQELQQKIEKLENRIQKLLEKYESGEYFGTVPEVDSEIKSYTISFEGSATSMDDNSVVNVEGQIHIENLLTIDDNVSKFRVNGGDISVDDTSYDIAFGKARVSSTGPSGEKNTIVLLGQVIDFSNPDDDSTTIKLVIDSETSLGGDFGLEPIEIKVLPQSKIAGQWHLSGSGELSLLD